MFSFGKKDTTGLAIDIGTSSIKAVLFSVSHDVSSKPRIEHIYRASLDVPRKPRADTLERQITKQLRIIITAIQKSIRRNISVVYIGLSSPFYISRLITLTSTRPKASSPITKEELSTLITKGEQSFIDEYISPKENIKLHLFGNILLKTTINGYHVPEITGSSGKTLVLYVRYETTTKKFYNELQKLISPLISEEKIHVTSSPTACFYALDSISSIKEGILHIDIGGEISEISIIHDSILEKIITIPLGNASLTRKISEYVNIPFKEGESLLRQYAKKTLDSKKSEKLKMVIDHHMTEWRTALSSSLSVYATENNIPSEIILSGGGAFLTAYQDVFSSEVLHRTHIPEQLRITTAEPALLFDRFDTLNALSGPKDFGISCLTLLCSETIL